MNFMRLITIACTISWFGFPADVAAQSLTVATYNIRYDNPRDSGNLWKDRNLFVASLIRYHGFDLFGTQEGLINQLQDLSAALREYSFYGRGREDGLSGGEHSAIFYRKDRFDVLRSGDFWLSETPDVPGPGWDASLNRICSWLRLKDKRSGAVFFVFNAHYDHRGIKARIESSRLVMQKIRSIAGKDPVIFMGDLNGGRDSEWYLEFAKSDLLTDAYGRAMLAYEPNGSFNSFRTDAVGKDVIDHIFITRQFSVRRWAVLTDTYTGKFPSDHFPVAADLLLER
jgi:endonuclease/exonuclease/phosphatase family metal-dependent hydrolase